MEGFTNLRWEDQEKIRKRIAKEGGAAGGLGGKRKGVGKEKKREEKKEPRSDLTVECAKSDRSSCRLCGENISYVSEEK